MWCCSETAVRWSWGDLLPVVFRTNLLVNSQELILPTGLLLCWFCSKRWYESRSCPGTLCSAGTKNSEKASSCAIQHTVVYCALIQVLTKEKKNSNSLTFATAAMRSVMIPDQILFLPEDETSRKILLFPSGVTLDFQYSKTVPNSAHCALLCSVS